MSMPLLVASLLIGSEASPLPDYLSLTPAAVQDAAAAEPPANPGWAGSLTLGVTYTSGNSDTLSGAFSFDAEKREEKDRWTFNALANYSEQTVETIVDDPDPGDPDVVESEDTTANNQSAKLQYDRFMTEKLYWYANTSAERDDIALLQLRAAAGVGAGYQFIEEEDLTFNGEAGLSYVHEDLEGHSPDEYPAARLAYNAGYNPSETTKLAQKAELLPSLQESDDWSASLDSSLDVTLTASMVLKLQHILDYDNTPAKGEPGIIGDSAEKADNRVLLTVGWTF